MTLPELLAAVHASGRSISSDGTTITLGPGETLPKKVLDGLKASKAELLELIDHKPIGNDTGHELIDAAMQAFPGARMRWLSDAEHDAIGFRSKKDDTKRLTPRAQRVQMLAAHPLPPAREESQQ